MVNNFNKNKFHKKIENTKDYETIFWHFITQ